MMTHHVSIARFPSLMDFCCKNLTWIYAYLIGWLRKTQSICQRCFSLYFSTLCLWTSVQNQTTQNKHLSRKQEAAFSVDRLPPCLFHLSLSGLSHCRWQNKCFWQSSSSEKHPTLSSEPSHKFTGSEHVDISFGSTAHRWQMPNKPKNLETELKLKCGGFCEAAW